MRCLGGQVPIRITDIPYIRKKHHELDPAIFKRKSIGSLSNCIACHTTAENGIYDDDDVKIPEWGEHNKGNSDNAKKVANFYNVFCTFQRIYHLSEHVPAAIKRNFYKLLN